MIAIGAYDALTARLVAAAGFDAVWLSGFCVSCSMGLPDNSVLTSDELVSRAQSIRATTDLPLIVDCDEGYGSPARPSVCREQSSRRVDGRRGAPGDDEHPVADCRCRR